MLKFLQKMLLLAALLAPWATQAQCTSGTSCPFSITMYGQYDDSWSYYGACSLGVYQNGTLVTSTDGDGALEVTENVTVCSGDSVYVIVTANMDAAYECSFTVYNVDGTAVVTDEYLSDYSVGDTVARFLPTCPTCIVPSAITATGTTVSWTDANNQAWDSVWGSGAITPDTVAVNMDQTTTNSYDFSALADGAYTVYVRANCGSGDYSAWVGPVNLAVGGCIVRVDGQDSYGDGWNGGSLDIKQNNAIVATLSIPSGNSGTVNAAVAGTSPVTFQWNAGSFESEVSFQIFDGSGAQMFSASGNPSSVNNFTLAQPCPTCFVPTAFAVDSIAPTQVYLSWTAGANETSWEVVVEGPTDTLVDYATSEEYEASNLDPYTFYNFKVRAICDVDDSSAFVTINGVRTLPSCPQPTHLTVDSVTSTEIYLSWYAGGEESEWVVTVNDSSFSTSDNPLTLTELSLNTLYTIGVSALCSSDDTSFVTSISARTLAGEPISEFPYTCGFEYDADNDIDQASNWVLLTENQTNYWMVGSATSNGGSRSLYVTNDGTSNGYNTSSISYSFAYAAFQFTAGEYAYSYDWKCYGESSYDFIRAAVVPASVSLSAGSYCGFDNSSAVPAGGIAIDGGQRLNLSSNWTNRMGTFTIPADGLYNVVFLWRNDLSSGTMPPAAIDNISITQLTCPSPVNFVLDSIHAFEAFLNWTAIGDESEWVVRTVSNGITSDWESVTGTPYTMTGLSSATNYTFQLAAVCGDGDTSFIVSTTGTTPVTCPAPTGFTVSVNDTTAVADFSWTDATGSNWEFVYGPMGFNPFLASDDVQSTSTTTYQISNLDTGFFDAYVRTDCGGGDYSTWVGPLGFHYGVTVMNMASTGSDTLYACAAIIYDDGGPTGSYSSSSQSTLVIYPSTPGADVVITGTSYTEGTYDYLRIYDGVGTAGEELWNDYGVSATQNFGPFSSSAITVVFHSDVSVQYSGFQINVACTAPSNCPKPTPFVVNSIQPDSVNVSWRNPAYANEFELVLGAPGFLPDTVSEPITVTDTFYVFNNLQGGVAYQAYVRANCGDEYSNWAGPLNFTPGLYVMGTSGAATVSMCGGVICDDGGLTGQYSNNVDYQLTVYPSHPDSMLVFQGTAYTESSIDYLRIYEGVGIAGNLLWQTSSSSQQDVIPQTTVMSGPITLHFHTDVSVIYDGFALQVSCVAAPECAAVENLQVTTGPVSAIATWDEGFFGTYSGATVEYKVDTVDTWTSLPMTTDKYAVITGLTPGTHYDLRVTTNCEGFDGNFATTSFTTGGFGCLEIDPTASFNDTIVNGTSTNSYIPSYSTYNYSLTQQIFTASEIGHGGNIASVYIMPSAYTVPRTLEVYMGHVSAATATSFLTPSDLVMVYSGSALQLNAGQWNELQLSTQFNYNGSDNLLIYFRDMTGSWNSGNSWYGAESTSGVSRYVYQDAAPYSIGYSGGTASSFRSNIILSIQGCLTENTCAAPVAAVADVTTTSVDIAWAPGNAETSWNVYYRQAGAANWSAPVAVTTTNYQFANLNSGTNYEFKVEGVCDTQLLATTVSAATLCATIATLPYTETFNSWGTGTLPNCWYNTGAYSPNSYSIISGSQNMTGATGGSIYMYSSSGSSISRIISPAIDTNLFQINQLQVVFGVKYTSTSYGAPSFTVGVMENPGDLSSLVPVANVQHSGTINSWEVIEVPLSNYTGNGSHIVIQTNYQGSYFYCYLDDFTIEPIPTCPRPDSLAVSNVTSTSVDLSWHERGGASTWIVEYGPVGFDLGTGTTVVATSNPFTLSGLPVAYVGEYYVRSVCSSTDTGEYSRVSCRFATSQIPATLPYLYTFENDTEWQNWQTASNVSNINWSRGNATASEGTYAMYISNDGGVSWASEFDKVVNASVYRDFDFGTTPNNYEVTFRAKAGGCFGQNIYDGIYVIMVDPADPMNISNNSYTTPWGYMPSVNVYQDTVWDTYTLFFDSVSGIKRIAINWYNTNSQNNGTIVQGGGAIDSFAVVLPSCPRPTGLQVISTAGTSAQIAWDGDAAGTYQVIYRPYPEGTSNTFVTVSGNQTTLTGLQSMTQYAFWVRKICGDGDTSSVGSGRLFTTEMCDNGTTVTNFDTTMTATTSSYSPIGYSYYSYSYVQTIIDSAQLADLASAGELTAMGFSANSTTAGNYFTNMTVYLTNLPDSLGDLSSSFIHPSDDLPFVKVIDNADFSYTTTGLQLHMFDTTFAWDGHSRILVSVVRNHGAWTNGSSFNAHTQSSGHMRYANNDNSSYDYTTVTGGNASTTVGDIYLISCGVGCAAPGGLSVTNVTYNSATLNWSGNADTYEVSVKAASEGTWPAPTTVNNANSFNVTGLVPETQYQFMVRAICDATEGLVSDWVNGTFTTDELPCFVPTELQTTAVNYTNATLTWTAGGAETEWGLHVWNSTFDTILNASATTLTVTGLAQTTQYNAAVKAICGGGAAESEYGDTIQFTTTTCPQVDGVTVSDITANSATVTWTDVSGASSYILEYGNAGFQQGQGTPVTVSNAITYTLTGLESEKSYSVFVRAVCAEDATGAWSSRVNFVTLEGGQTGINGADGANLSIYPNPTTSTTTIALSGVSGSVSVNIVDMNGRVVMSDTMSCEGDCAKTMEVSGLAQGAYFVRISGENVNMVKKLVVK